MTATEHTTQPVMTLTGDATAKIAQLLTEEADDQLALRVAVRAGGCSGFSYEMYFDSDTNPDDHVATFGSSYQSKSTLPAHEHIIGATLTLHRRHPGSRFQRREPQRPTQLRLRSIVLLTAAELATDTLGRPVRDLRISVTDRCNFRCTYCMPKEIFNREYEFLARDKLLSFEEIDRVARSFVRHGVRKLRLTGGEPLLRNGIEDLVAKLAEIRDVEDLTLTTNGALLGRKASDLAAAGLRRVTVSLDSMDDSVFMAMNDVGFGVQGVLDGIAAAAEAGLGPIKINMVVKRGVNDGSIVDMARHFKEHRAHRPVHRVHGCRHHQRLASRRRGARPGTSSRR